MRTLTLGAEYVGVLVGVEVGKGGGVSVAVEV
jgi:hypothetical protein